MQECRKSYKNTKGVQTKTPPKTSPEKYDELEK